MAAYAQPPPLELELKLCIKFNAACGSIKSPEFIIIVNSPTYSILYHPNLQGQMMYIPETDRILFQCYPSVMNLDDLTK